MGGSALAAVDFLVVAVVQLGDKIGGKFCLVRICAWLNLESQAQDKGFQTLQALYAIGRDWGRACRSVSCLSAQNDTIFHYLRGTGIVEWLPLFSCSLCSYGE